jgi:hypothetical protein
MHVPRNQELKLVNESVKGYEKAVILGDFNVHLNLNFLKK